MVGDLEDDDSTGQIGGWGVGTQCREVLLVYLYVKG